MDRPNVLLVVLDSTRADRLSCYGYEKPTTPNLDRIAAEGTRFEQCWSESSWTLPVSYTLMTGLAAREHRAEPFLKLPDDLPTLPDAMRLAGYETLMCSANAFMGPFTGLDRGFDRTYLAPHIRPVSKPIIKYVLAKFGRADLGGISLTRTVLRFIARARAPWFAVVWYNDCHHPYITREPFTSRFLETPITRSRRWELMDRMRNMEELAATMTADDRRDISGLYDGAVAYSDHIVGSLRAGLERLGAWNDSVFVATADHGQMLGEHGLTSHGRPAGMYRPLIRVPLIVRAPGMVPTGGRSDAIVQLSDVTETLARIGGRPDALAPTGAERLDLRDAAAGDGRGQAVSERAAWPERKLRRAQHQNPHFNFAPFAGHMASWITGDWEFIGAQTARDELYHLAEDQLEDRNLIAEEPERAQQMRAALQDWQARVRPHPAVEDRDEEAAEDPEVRKRLEGMGYF